MAEDKKEQKELEFGVDLEHFSFANASHRVTKRDSEIRQRNAMKLIRVMISPNDDNKTSYDGEIFCVRNKVFEGVKKFVPFHKPTHIPMILYNMIKNKKCQKYKRERNSLGSVTVTRFQIPAYNIQVLPPLTSAEFNAIRERQLAESKSLEA